ncbi:MAG: response regulator [Rikenellaceae bacterium]
MTHLLLVSNDPLRAKVISMALQADQVDVQCIDTSECIINHCQAHHTDLVIFLTLSPYFSSMNIIEQLKRQLDYMPRVYAISHSHSQATILSLLECGVDQYMTFPLNLYRLRDKVYSLIAQ